MSQECRLCYPGECTPASHAAAEAAEFESETCKICGATPGTACDSFEHRAAVALDTTMRRARMTAAAFGTKKEVPASAAARAPAGQQHLVEQPALTRKQITRLRELLGVLDESLTNKTMFRWGEGARVLNTRLLRRAGVELMTKTALAKTGLEPKRGQKPVGTGYFGVPLQVHAELYLVGVQTKPRALPRNPAANRDDEASAATNQRRSGHHGP